MRLQTDGENQTSRNQPKNGATISEILIDISDNPKIQKKWEPLVRSLIDMNRGDGFAVQKMENAVAVLKSSGRFSHIHSEINEKGPFMEVTFKLTPYPLVKDIVIKGAFPLFTTDILSVMTLASGDVFTEEELAKQETWILDFLKNEGYPDAKVAFAPQTDKTGHIIIHVNIEKGTPLKVGELKIKGNHNFSSFWLKSKMTSNPAVLGIRFKTVYNEKNLKSDIKELDQFYRKKNFFDARVDYEIQKTKDHQINIHVIIDEGAFYKIVFKGNDKLSKRQLKKQLTFYDTGNKNNTGIRRSASNIMKFYKQSGFPEVRVKTIDSLDTDKRKTVRTIIYEIKEGPRRKIEDLSIKGNTIVSEKKIKNQMLTEKSGAIFKHYLSPETLQEDVDAIETIYRQKGFLSPDIATSVEDNPAGGITVAINIHENVQTDVASITIKGLSAITEKEALETVRMNSGTPFRDYMVKSDENTLSAAISEKGYPYVTVSGSYELSQNQKQAHITYDVKEGKQVVMGEIIFTGNFKTKERILLRELKLKPGAPFSLKKMLEGQTNIRNLGLFKTVAFNPVGLDKQQEVVHLFVELEEYKPLFFELGVGYESNRGMFINTKAGDKNLLGKNKNIWFEIDVSEIGNRFDIGIVEPRFLGEKITFTSGVFWERKKEFNQSFGTKTIGAHAGLFKSLSARTNVGVNLQFEQKDEFDHTGSQYDVDPDLKDTTGIRHLLTVTPFIAYDARDSFTQPTKGKYGNITVDISKSLTNATDNFVKYRLDLRYFREVFKNGILGWIGKTGLIKSYQGDETVPSDQLFYLGGVSDVRGYDENLLAFDTAGKALGGRSAISSSLEFRYLFDNHIVLPLFYDIGRIDQAQAPGFEGRFRSSYGTGILYLTPIGPIGFFYGRKISPEEDESKDAFHFSIGYSF